MRAYSVIFLSKDSEPEEAGNKKKNGHKAINLNFKLLKDVIAFKVPWQTVLRPFQDNEHHSSQLNACQCSQEEAPAFY